MKTHTTAPQFRNPNVVAEAVSTETKTTQGNTFAEHTLKEKVTVQYTYTKVEYEAGAKVPELMKGKEGFYRVCGYGNHMIEGFTRNGKEEKTNYLPLELFETKRYAVVREYKTTVWEIK
jgi:hypothetical protein